MNARGDRDSRADVKRWEVEKLGLKAYIKQMTRPVHILTDVLTFTLYFWYLWDKVTSVFLILPVRSATTSLHYFHEKHLYYTISKIQALCVSLKVV